MTQELACQVGQRGSSRTTLREWTGDASNRMQEDSLARVPQRYTPALLLRRLVACSHPCMCIMRSHAVLAQHGNNQVWRVHCHAHACDMKNAGRVHEWLLTVLVLRLFSHA